MSDTFQPGLGQLIDKRYRIQSILSMGASGVVWNAWHENLQRPLAIKTIDVGNMDPATIERVKRECQIGGQLTGLSNVVGVLDALQEGSYLLIVMDLMEGGDLASRIRKQPTPFAQALNWALDLCSTLEQVHQLGIIHRDIKPQNILLDSHAQIKLCDFGIAHVSRSHLTEGVQPGTPAYKAPELDNGLQASTASDVYSLCAVLFELWGSRQYADYKALDATLVRREFLECLANEHKNTPEECRRIVADAILSGLMPLGQRIDLPQLRDHLQRARPFLDHPDSKQQLVQTPPATAPKYIPQPNVILSSSSSSFEHRTIATDWLIEELEYAFQEEIWKGSRRTLFFWYDPDGLWSAIVPTLEGRIPLIVDRGSLLEVRYELEQRDDNELTVLYLRRGAGQISYLTPYEFSACILTLDPYNVLRNHGVPLPTTSPGRQALQSLIPQLLVASLGQGESFWQSISSYEDARIKLLGDVQELLFRFLAAPSEFTWTNMPLQGQEQLFSDEILQLYGYSNSNSEPWAFAKGLVANWCLVDIFEGYGQPADFPFRDALPPFSTWSNCRSALQKFRNDRRFQAAVVQITREIEQQYTRLIEWAESQSVTFDDAPLFRIAQIAFRRLIEHVNTYKEREALIAFLRSNLSKFEQRCQGFWAQQGSIPQWDALCKATELLLAAERACKDCAQISQLADFITAYTESWWKIDAEYCHYHTLPESDISLVALTSWIEQSYHRYLELVNRSWTQLLQSVNTWPPIQSPEPQWKLWSSIAQSKGRRAVFFVDALRYDVAQMLADELDKNDTVTVTRRAAFSGLPSITPLGMASLLPQAERQMVAWEKDWHITGPKSKGNLADKGARENFLKQSLHGVVTLSLEELLLSQKKLPQEIAWLLVFSQEIDSLGENVSSLAFDTLANTAHRLAQGARKVIDAGFSSVHIVTDHGFLLLNQIAESDKIACPISQPLKLGQRYLVEQNLPETPNLLRFSIRGSDNLWAYYPPGIAAFSTPGRYNYSHGGPTLHETIIPYLLVKSTRTQRKVGVELTLQDEIFNPIFRIELHPKDGHIFDLEREIRIAIELPNNRLLHEVEELVSVTGSVAKNLRIHPADHIVLGDTIVVVVRDAQTGEELDRKTAVVRFELDF